MSERATLLDALQERLGHRFADPGLLDRALTHSSWTNENPDDPDNERLEFLGDAVLDGMVAHALFQRFPRAEEGVLSRMKHKLVQARTLAAVGRDLGLSRVLRVGVGAEKAGVQHNPSKIEDATEALVAALFLDAGFERTAEIVAPWFAAHMDRLYRERPKGSEAYKNAITRLHEAVDRPPVRARAHEVVLGRIGPSHASTFRMGWWVGGTLLGEGTGPKKKVALREAAEAALERLDALLAEGWRPDRTAEPPQDWIPENPG